MIATLGTSALAYFLLFDALLGAGGARRGGVVGANIWWALHALVGGAGASILLLVALLSLTLWLTGASLKKTIGRAMLLAAQLRPPPRPALSPSDDQPLELKLEPIVSVPAIVRGTPAPALFEEEEEIDGEPPFVAPVKVAPKAVVRKPPPEPRAAGGYRLPDLSLFDVPQNEKVDESSRSHVLEDTLASFGVGAKVVHIDAVRPLRATS